MSSKGVDFMAIYRFYRRPSGKVDVTATLYQGKQIVAVMYEKDVHRINVPVAIERLGTRVAYARPDVKVIEGSASERGVTL